MALTPQIPKCMACALKVALAFGAPVRRDLKNLS